MIAWRSSTEYFEFIDGAVKHIKPQIQKLGIDGIIAAGRSGLLLAYPVAQHLGIPCLMIGDFAMTGDRHKDEASCPASSGQSFVFIDDHFGSGRTFTRCHTALHSRDVIRLAQAKVCREPFVPPQIRWVYMYNTHWTSVENTEKYFAKLVPVGDLGPLCPAVAALAPPAKGAARVMRQAVRDASGRFAPKAKVGMNQYINFSSTSGF